MLHGSVMDQFIGAYFSGSAAEMPDAAELPEYSDIDVMVVLASADPPGKLGKFLYNGVLLEVTYLAWNELSSPEDVLASHHLANSLRADTVIADTSGRLRGLQAQVSLHFAEEEWVRRRCANVLEKIRSGLQGINASAPFHDQVTQWLFPTGIMTHVILLAALRNPTVRKRYLAAREALLEYGREDIYHSLLGLLGCARLTPALAEKHLNGLAGAFDAAAAVARTPFPFISDITAAARPIAIDASRRLIQTGNHREAVFWLVATYARCLKILAADAPADLDAYLPAFEEMMAGFGIASTRDITRRAEEAVQLLPALWETAEDIMMKNPEIKNKRHAV